MPQQLLMVSKRKRHTKLPSWLFQAQTATGKLKLK
jgi:hypothetical protein